MTDSFGKRFLAQLRVSLLNVWICYALAFSAYLAISMFHSVLTIITK